jgi:hypothetical protein
MSGSGAAPRQVPVDAFLRGGSFNTPFEHAKSFETNDAAETMMDDDSGLRCVLDLDVDAEQTSE